MKRFFFYSIGILLIGISINLLINSNKGLDPWGIFNVAAAGSLSISLGVFYIISGFIFVILNAIIQKKFPDIFGMITSFLMGVSIDVFAPVISGLSFYSKWLDFSLGLIGLCFGLALYLSTSLPRSPVDDLIYSIQKLTKKSFKISKIVLDSGVLVIGLILGGTIGVGTLLMVILIGPLITLFMNLLEEENAENNMLRFRRYAYSNSRKLRKS